MGGGGEGGIRTHGTLQYAAFRVRYIRPLCHFSVRYIITAFLIESLAIVVSNDRFILFLKR